MVLKKLSFLLLLSILILTIHLTLFATPDWWSNQNRPGLNSIDPSNVDRSLINRNWLYDQDDQEEEELTPEEKERKRMKELYDDLEYLQPIRGLAYGVIPDRPNHWGIDIKAPLYHEVLACQDGVVTAAHWRGNYGQLICISHSRGYETRYSHLARMNVEAGDSVKRGDVIGYIGVTGRCTGPHVHFEIRKVIATGYYSEITTPLPLRHMRYIIKAGVY